MRISLLVPNACPGMAPEQRRAHQVPEPMHPAVVLPRLLDVDLDPRQVLSADVAVLPWADESQRRAMVPIERLSVEPVGKKDVVGQPVLEVFDDPEPVEASEDEPCRVGDQLRLDQLA